MAEIDKLRGDKRVLDVADEREDGDGIWVYLVPGFCNPITDPMNPSHSIHESSVSGVRSVLAGVKPCACAACKQK